jgi:hypothetical protein
MVLAALVFLSDMAITWLAAQEKLALQELSWSAVWWDGAFALALGINMIGFVKAVWLMIPVSVAGSMTGMGLAIWHGRQHRHV